MVVDPGIHLFGWSHEQAMAFMLENGTIPFSYLQEHVESWLEADNQ